MIKEQVIATVVLAVMFIIGGFVLHWFMSSGRWSKAKRNMRQMLIPRYLRRWMERLPDWLRAPLVKQAETGRANDEDYRLMMGRFYYSIVLDKDSLIKMAAILTAAEELTSLVTDFCDSYRLTSCEGCLHKTTSTSRQA